MEKDSSGCDEHMITFEWYKFNDSFITLIKPEDYHYNFISRNAYVSFYIKQYLNSNIIHNTSLIIYICFYFQFLLSQQAVLIAAKRSMICFHLLNWVIIAVGKTHYQFSKPILLSINYTYVFLFISWLSLSLLFNCIIKRA